ESRLLQELVRPERFELPTYCSGGNRSIQLSYGRNLRFLECTCSDAGVSIRRRPALEPTSGWDGRDARPPTENRSLLAVPAASTTIPAAAPPAPATLGLGTRFIHVQLASANLGAVERSDGFVSILGTGHLNEAEAAGASGVAVGHDADPVDLSVGGKELAQ